MRKSILQISFHHHSIPKIIPFPKVEIGFFFSFVGGKCHHKKHFSFKSKTEIWFLFVNSCTCVDRFVHMMFSYFRTFKHCLCVWGVSTISCVHSSTTYLLTINTSFAKDIPFQICEHIVVFNGECESSNIDYDSNRIRQAHFHDA